MGPPSSKIMYPINMTTLVFDSFPVFWHEISQANLEHILFQFWNQPFLQGPFISFSGKWYFRVLMTIRLSLFPSFYKVRSGKLAGFLFGQIGGWNLDHVLTDISKSNIKSQDDWCIGYTLYIWSV